MTGLGDDDHTQYQKEADFAAGSVLFRGTSAITEDNSNFYWDDTSNRLGVGTATPAKNVHITDGGTAGIRLERTSAPSQPWDIEGNDLGLFLRNSASGSTDSWSFRPGGALELGLNGIVAFEGSLDDDFETTVVAVNPTADRAVIIPDADSATARAVACAGTDKVSAFNAATGQFACAPDQTGATDHGALTGLGDDDHTQYQKEADFSAGSVLFRGTAAIAEDNGNLYWDDTTNRLGVGTTSPSNLLHVEGTGEVRDSIAFGNIAAGNHDIYTKSNDDYIRIYAQNAPLSGIPGGAALQFFGNSSAIPGSAFIDTGSVAGAYIAFRAQGTSAFATERGRIGIAEAVFNEPGDDYDFRVESDTDTHNIFSDASENKVGIGDSTPTEAKLVVGGNFYVLTNTAVGSDPLCWDGSGGSVYGDCTSRGEYKQNVRAYSGGLAEILRLRPRAFDWKRRADGTLATSTPDYTTPDVGFISEEVAAVNPDLVRWRDEGNVGDVDERALIAALVNALREQQNQIGALAARIAELEGSHSESRMKPTARAGETPPAIHRASP